MCLENTSSSNVERQAQKVGHTWETPVLFMAPGQALLQICVFSFQFIQIQYSGEIKYSVNLKLPNPVHKW
jgi:hypothetical protein